MPRAAVIGSVALRDMSMATFDGEEVASGECGGVKFVVYAAVPGGSLIVRIDQRMYGVDVYDLVEAAITVHKGVTDGSQN